MPSCVSPTAERGAKAALPPLRPSLTAAAPDAAPPTISTFFKSREAAETGSSKKRASTPESMSSAKSTSFAASSSAKTAQRTASFEVTATKALPRVSKTAAAAAKAKAPAAKSSAASLTAAKSAAPMSKVTMTAAPGLALEPRNFWARPRASRSGTCADAPATCLLADCRPNREASSDVALTVSVKANVTVRLVMSREQPSSCGAVSSGTKSDTGSACFFGTLAPKFGSAALSRKALAAAERKVCLELAARRGRRLSSSKSLLERRTCSIAASRPATYEPPGPPTSAWERPWPFTDELRASCSVTLPTSSSEASTVSEKWSVSVPASMSRSNARSAGGVSSARKRKGRRPLNSDQNEAETPVPA
mmetsp:Transcript_12975/g.45640  ORF Transcript_12975/g.45640 Transcript_12975/m.45640 type:complete len:364 (+) Transcript_12975:1146-2237(+)